MAWSSIDGDSPRSGSNQGSVAHLSEVNQESITSRGKEKEEMLWEQKQKNTSQMPEFAFSSFIYFNKIFFQSKLIFSTKQSLWPDEVGRRA